MSETEDFATVKTRTRGTILGEETTAPSHSRLMRGVLGADLSVVPRISTRRSRPLRGETNMRFYTLYLLRPHIFETNSKSCTWRRQLLSMRDLQDKTEQELEG